MELTDEQAKNIKEQIFKQVENFPPEKREQIKEYISKMNNQELEEFLIKNKMIKQEGGPENESDEEQDNEIEREHSDSTSEKKSNTNCVMCLISNKQIESFIVYEDKDYLGVLEINPITKGHTILIPKQHIKEAKEIKSKAFTIANKIGKRLVTKLEAENFQINTSDELKHAIINILPKYKDQIIDFKRKPTKKEELQELSQTIGKIIPKPPVKRVAKTKENKDKDKDKSEKEDKKPKIIQLPRRIP